MANGRVRKRQRGAPFERERLEPVMDTKRIKPGAGVDRAKLRQIDRLWSAKMMRAAVWASCGFAGQLVFMVQPVQHRRGNHTTTRGQAMGGGPWSDQRG